MTLVIDAGVVVAALVDEGLHGQWAESMLASGPLAVPHLMPVEVANVLRRACLAGTLGVDSAQLAHADLLKLRVVRFGYELVAELSHTPGPRCVFKTHRLRRGALVNADDALSIGGRARKTRSRRGLNLEVAGGLAGISGPYLSMLEDVPDIPARPIARLTSAAAFAHACADDAGYGPAGQGRAALRCLPW